MKIVLALLILFSSEIYAQQPIEIKEGESPRQVTSFTCRTSGEVLVETFGITPRYFNITQHKSTAIVYLVKPIDLHNNADFPVISGNECLKQVDLSNIAIVVKCQDPEFIENRTVRITPKRVQDPYICNTSCRNFSNPLKVNIPENTTAGSAIEKFKLCSNDINVDTSLYGIKITGILEEKNKDTFVLRTKLDYESQPHNMKSEVSINGKSVLNISISILDSDDLGVTFSKTFYECQIPENKKGYMTNCDVKAEDMDKGINAAVGYSIISVTPTAVVFDLLQNGSFVLKQPLDRENTSLYRIYIKGYQLDRPNDSVNYTTLQVRVTDVNDNPPVVSAGNCRSTTVFENSRIGTIVCQLSFTDADEGKNAKNEFHINGKGNKFLEVEKETGFLKVKSLIDRESNEIRNPITFEVYAAPVGDSSPQRRSNLVSVNVTVLDENDNSPSFTNAEMTINIRKTQALHVKLTQIRATDPDEKENGRVNYTLLNGNNLFNLNPSSGNLTLTKSLNETFQSVYHLTIRATDQCVDVHNQRSSVMFLTVKVDDVNVHTPYFFSNMSKTVNISEDLPIGTIVMEIKAGDKDPTDVLTFSLLGDHEKFVLEDKLIKIKDGLDREKKDNYNLSVSVNDSVHVTTTYVNVIVIDVNDNSPNFLQKRYTFNVTEEDNNVAVGFVKADDIDFGDNGKVEYYIDKNNPWYSNFTVKATNKGCEIRTRGKIDREKIENGHNIQFLVFANDLGSPQRTNSSSVEITVLDINDHVPQFVKTFPNTFTVKEDTRNLSNVFQVSAVDPDYGENGQVLYRIGKGTKSAGLFEVDSTSGFISLKSSPKIEACNDSVHVITVEAYNPILDNKNSVLNITCSIEDVNNHKPVFDYLRTSAEIMESNHLTREDIDVCFDGKTIHLTHNIPCKPQAASDADCLESHSKLFYWMNNNDDRFKINSSTGIISIKKGSSLDFDTLPHRNTINVTIHATDGLYRADKTLTLNIMNHPDSLPEFSKETFMCTVDECPERNLRCSLPLRNENDTVRGNFFSYVLSKGGNNTNFALMRNGKTAEIVLKTCYDFEQLKNNTFVLEVQVRSNIITWGTSCNVIITIKNINDNAPIFGNSTYKYSILETYNAGSVLGRISASDADNLGNITYTLEHNEYLTYTGEILQLKKVPDLDKGALKPPINGTIYAFDGIHNVSTNIEITVKAVNEYPPVFNQLLYNVTVQENAKSNVKLQAHDNDKGKDGNIAQYVLHIPEKWNKNITPENDTVVILGFDRDTMGSSSMIQFTVEAVDGGVPPRTGEALVRIIVEGVNDNIPKFPTDERAVFIYRPEGATAGVIFTAKAIDKDIGAGSNVLYRLNPTHHSFQINETSGIVSCTEDLFIDKDNKGRFSIVVEAFNEGSKESDSLSIILKLTDGNNHSPVFDNCTTSFDLIETNETDVVVAVLSAHDEDKGRNGIITFSLLEVTANSPFRVFNRTNSTCVVKTVRPVDREHQDTYNLVVKATDNGINGRTGICTVVINVLDLNDNTSRLGALVYSGSIFENSKRNASVVVVPDITASDPDLGVNGSEGFQFMLNDTTSPFCLSPDGLKASVYVCNDTDRELQDTYFLEVTVHDRNGASSSLHSSAPLTIHILDVNDEAPQFTESVYRFNVSENSGIFMSLGKVVATDKDINENNDIKFGIAKGDDGKFHIDTYSGIISVIGNIDREQKSRYELYVDAFDGVHRTFAAVNVTVTDVNDNPPLFTMLVIDVEENRIGIIYNTSVYDKDERFTKNSKVSFSVTGRDSRGVEVSNFGITEDGRLNLTSPLDREKEDSYEVTITAKDNGMPSLSSSLTFYINVFDVNDNDPVICVDGQCELGEMDIHIKYETPAMSVVKIFDSRDPDLGSNATATFSLIQSKISDFFGIDPTTGKLKILDPKALQTVNLTSSQLFLKVLATDSGGRTSKILTLHVHLDK